MVDPAVNAIVVGFLGASIAGPAAVYTLQSIPQQWRRTSEWLLIGGAGGLAISADLPFDSAAGGALVYVLAALPGVLAFLVWRTLVASALISLAPLYFVMADMTRGRPSYTPDVPLDHAITLQPAWMLVYGSLYVFGFILPLLVVRQRQLFRRTMQADLTVMLLAYAGFLLYPTVAPRPAEVPGDGFAAWALRLAYSLDPPHGCFPSLHVAYSFVAAFACHRVHRGVGAGALLWATLIGLSTLYTKQHYVLDVIAGVVVAYAAYLLFLRPPQCDPVSASDRQRAPLRALGVIGIFAIVVAGFWVAYRVRLASP